MFLPGITALIYPKAKPYIMFVAAPVSQDLANSLTGVFP